MNLLPHPLGAEVNYHNLLSLRSLRSFAAINCRF